MIFVGIDIATCSAIREDKTRAGQEEGNTQSQSPATEFRGAASQCVHGGGHGQRTKGGQDPATQPGHKVHGQEKDQRRRRKGQEELEEDKSCDTEPSHTVQVRGQEKRRARPDTPRQGQQEDKGTRPGHRAGPQSPATELRGAAKTRPRGGQGPDTEPYHTAQSQNAGRGQDKEKRRTKPGHRAQPTEFRGAASECGQFFPESV